jgi:hypothetical protein
MEAQPGKMRILQLLFLSDNIKDFIIDISQVYFQIKTQTSGFCIPPDQDLRADYRPDSQHETAIPQTSQNMAVNIIKVNAQLTKQCQHVNKMGYLVCKHCKAFEPAEIWQNSSQKYAILKHTSISLDILGYQKFLHSK